MVESRLVSWSKLPAVTFVVLVTALGVGGAAAGSMPQQVVWSRPSPMSRKIAEPEGLACPSASLCIGGATNRSVLINSPTFILSREPAVAASWHFDDGRRSPGLLGSFACPSSHMCVAIGLRGITESVMASKRPGAGASSFSAVAQLTHGSVACATRGPYCLACPTPGFCITSPVMRVSRDPARRGSWYSRSSPPGHANIADGGVVCSSAQLCMVFGTVGQTKRVAVVRNPAEPHSRWQVSTADPEADSYNVIRGSCHRDTCLSEQITGAACAAPTSCLLTTDYGAVIASADIAAHTVLWTRAQIYGSTPAVREYYGLSNPVCFSTSLCYVLGARGNLLISRSPFSGDAAGWTTIPIPGVREPTDLACVSPRECLVVGRRGRHHERYTLTVGHISAG